MSITASLKQRKTARTMQRALRKNPNDIEALLQLVDMLDSHSKPDTTQKRRVLRQILCIEADNVQARKMLFEMDRAEIGGDASRLSLAVILTDPARDIIQTPLVLRYSIVHRFLVYLCVAFAIVVGLSIVRDLEGFALVGSLLLFLLIPIWFVSAVVEIRDSGLSISRLFGAARLEMPWRDITAVRPTFLGRGIKLIGRAGRAVELSTQVQGYPFILDILQQMRPDLFDSAEGSKPGNTTQHHTAVTPKIEKTVCD